MCWGVDSEVTILEIGRQGYSVLYTVKTEIAGRHILWQIVIEQRVIIITLEDNGDITEEDSNNITVLDSDNITVADSTIYYYIR